MEIAMHRNSSTPYQATEPVPVIGRVLTFAIAPLCAAVAALRRRSRRHAQYRHLEALPGYLLKDMGFRRDQIGGVVSGGIKRDPLALSPAGSQSSPAFRNATIRTLESANSDMDNRLAA